MNKTSLLFGVHMHQPVDNFSFCIQEAVEKSYLPFFETMAQYPAFKFAVHSSGWLLEQIQKEYPRLFDLLRELTQKGSIEWFSAGFYEPVLSSIPSKDRRAQIKKLNAFLKTHFKVEPKGLWLTERVWESSLVPDIAACNIRYCVVDDYHFLSSAFSKDHLDGYYVTEEGGDENALFPISKKLRYVLPFSSVEKAIETILSYASSQHCAAIFFDDAEKFGLWPNTHDWVYNQGWLKNFVQAVLDNEQIVSEHFSEYYAQYRSKGIAYLNNTSYIEMGEWSLGAKEAKGIRDLKQNVGEGYFEETGVAFIKGGIWKNFFVKYSESNYLHKRMLGLSLKSGTFSKEQKESLYKLQTNDVFWHGVFGGIYLPNLRDNAYKYLLEIESTLDDAKVELLDIDKDGYEELKVKTEALSLVFSSRYGGQMMEFGSFEKRFNWQNTMTRREEVYHLHDEHHAEKEEIDSIHDGAKMDEGLRSELCFDPSPRYSFIDHLSAKKITLERFKNLDFDDVADFMHGAFTPNAEELSFSQKGLICLDKAYETHLTKSYTCKGNSVTLDLALHSACDEELYYSSELNFHFAHMFDVTINDQKIGEGLSLYQCSQFAIYDDFTQKVLMLKANIPLDVHACMISTISKSESGFEKTPQHISILFTTPMRSTMALQLSLEVLDV